MRKALAILLLAAGCAAEPPLPPPVLAGPAAHPSQAAQVLPVVAIRWESQPVLRDPASKPEAAPASLTASDGEGLAIKALSATAVIEDPLAFTELHFTFKNPQARAIEGRFEVTLPPGATISRFAMRQEWGWQEGEVVELQAARAAYEDALHRRVDPALLEKQAGNRFQARVFPIPASGEKEIIFSYSQELTRAGDPYRLYLDGLPRLGALDVRVLHDTREAGSPGRRSFEIHQTDFKPDHDFTLALPAPSPLPQGLRRGRLAVARITPVAEAAPDPVGSLLVLFDTSASRALGFRAEVERLGHLVEALRRSGGDELPLSVLCFDQDVEVIHDGPARAFGRDKLDAILARKALGASDLGKAMHRAAAFLGSHGRRARALVMSDGIVTAGETDVADYRGLLAGLRTAGVERLDALVSGGIRDEARMKQLAVGGLGRDGMTLDGALPPAELAARLNQRAVSGIKVSVPGSAWVWPSTLDGVQAGNPTVIYADIPEDKPFEVVLGGAAQATRQTLAVRSAEAPMLERALVNAEIRRLMDELHATGDDARRDLLKQRVIGLSTRYRVLSDFTGLLILETEQDYARFKIDRQALAEILTVGPTGVELLNRTRAPLQVAAPEAGSLPVQNKRGATQDQADDAPRKKASAANAVAGEEPLPPPPAPEPAASATPRAEAPAAEKPLPPPPPAEPATVAGFVRPTSPAAGGVVGAAAPAPPAARPSPRMARDLDGEVSPWRGDPGYRAPIERNEDTWEESGPAPYTGRLAEVMDLIAHKKLDGAFEVAMRWHEAEPGDVLALVALGEASEALGQKTTAARAYGSIIESLPLPRRPAPLRRGTPFAARPRGRRRVRSGARHLPAGGDRAPRPPREPPLLCLRAGPRGSPRGRLRGPPRRRAAQLSRGALRRHRAHLPGQSGHPRGRLDPGPAFAPAGDRGPAPPPRRRPRHAPVAAVRADLGDRRQRRRLPHPRRQGRPRLLPEPRAPLRRRALRRRDHGVRARVLHHRGAAARVSVSPPGALLLARSDGLRDGQPGGHGARRQRRAQVRRAPLRGDGGPGVREPGDHRGAAAVSRRRMAGAPQVRRAIFSELGRRRP